ncbi:hypothetical protein JCM17961_06630 [Endothiovibrio diazotrophicus]
MERREALGHECRLHLRLPGVDDPRVARLSGAPPSAERVALGVDIRGLCFIDAEGNDL